MLKEIRYQSVFDIHVWLYSHYPPYKHGKTGELGQDRLEVRWEAVMFLFNVVNLNV